MGYVLVCWTSRYGAFMEVTAANLERWWRKPKKMWKSCLQLENAVRKLMRDQS